MIGIDVVDLRNPRTHGRHQDERFLNRIFSAEEQRAIRDSGDPELTLWRFWAMKEAAFKAISSALHRQSPPTFAHPDFQGRLELSDGALRGWVSWRDREVRIHLHHGDRRAEDPVRDHGGAGGHPSEDPAAAERPAWCAATALLSAEEISGPPGSLPDHRIAATRVVAAEVGTADADPSDPADALARLLSLIHI